MIYLISCRILKDSVRTHETETPAISQWMMFTCFSRELTLSYVLLTTLSAGSARLGTDSFIHYSNFWMRLWDLMFTWLLCFSNFFLFCSFGVEIKDKLLRIRAGGCASCLSDWLRNVVLLTWVLTYINLLRPSLVLSSGGWWRWTFSISLDVFGREWCWLSICSSHWFWGSLTLIAFVNSKFHSITTEPWET